MVEALDAESYAVILDAAMPNSVPTNGALHNYDVGTRRARVLETSQAPPSWSGSVTDGSARVARVPEQKGA